VRATGEVLGRRVPPYEAAFEHEGAACRVDLLVPVAGDAWDLYEVKSTGSVKDVHLDDVAFQTWVVRGAGIKLRRAHLVHLDTSYVRGDELEIERLFTLVELTRKTTERMAEVPARVRSLQAVKALGAAPEVAIGPHCSDPYDCALVEHCWAEVPDESVLTLRRGGRKGWELWRQGVRELSEIPAAFSLNRTQRVQVEAARTREPQVDRVGLRSFLDRLEYPLHYLDFETFMSAVPPYRGTRPYQQIPFQFSLFVVDGPDATPREVAFLAEGDSDPRPSWLAALEASIGPTGSIVAYRDSFERGRIAEAVLGDPRLEAWADSLNPRFVDLLVPFERFHYYHPDQLGSASLKAVLPILGERGYDELEIREGDLASREYLRSISAGTSAEERETIRRALLDYCARDTEGMIEIVAELGRVVEGQGKG
jgi:hypothetical protein